MAGLSAAVRPVVPVFEVEFTGGSAGRCCRGPLAELWGTPFERAAPVRSFPSFRGQASFPGLYYAATMDAHVGFESWLERDVAMMLDFDAEVVAFSSQPFWLFWAQDGEQRRHVPDYFARLADGTGVVIDVRPDDRIEPRDAECCWAHWRQRGHALSHRDGEGQAAGAYADSAARPLHRD